MTMQERNAWQFGIIAILSYGVYLALVLTAAQQVPLHEVDYVPAMLWTIGGAIAVGILVGIVNGAVRPQRGPQVDERDRQIEVFGERVGQAFVVIGALGALVLTMLEADHFWIANALYLGFVLSAVLSSLARIGAYREGFEL